MIVGRRAYERRYPELSRFESREERDAAIRRACNERRYARFRNPRVIVPLLVGVAGWTLIFFPPGNVIHPSQSPWSRVGVALLWAAVIAMPWLQWRWERRLMSQSLRRQLLERDLRVCLKCGYDLTGNESGICPECGTEVMG